MARPRLVLSTTRSEAGPLSRRRVVSLQTSAAQTRRAHTLQRRPVFSQNKPLQARPSSTRLRTFFRHFTDKREVLFWGASALQDLVVGAVAAAPDAATPLEAVAAGLGAAASLIEQRGEAARKRQTVIGAHAELRERELIKLASLASAIADALRRRGVPEPLASLTAEAGVAVFRIAFVRWIDAMDSQTLSEIIRDTLEKLKVVTAGGRSRRAIKARTAPVAR